jgi:protein-S-isoprenylcysteine O-methyltransferase Ste14
VIETVFRLAFIVILVTAFGISGYFRRRARQSGAIPRSREGGAMVLLRLAFALPFFLAMVAYALNPRWMAWAALPLPTAARVAGILVGLAMLPLLLWVFRSIGRNISETTLTKSDHELVTHGPYRWVRHPLYSAATVAFVALGVIAANAFIIAFALVIFGGMALLVVPREEAELSAKFGAAYQDYRRRTGGLFPRFIFDTPGDGGAAAGAARGEV